MERIYHYLSVNNYETLKGGGCLEARTTPILCCDENIPLSNNAELDNFCAGKYIVGSNSRDFAAWKKYGLFEDLMRQVGKESCGAVVLLSFSAEDNKNAYILDHRHLSPKTFLELCGEDLWEQKLGLLVPLERGGFPDDKRKIFERQAGKYANSLTKLSQYDDSFEVPEIWIPQKIPMQKLTLERTEFVEGFADYPQFAKDRITSILEQPSN